MFCPNFFGLAAMMKWLSDWRAAIALIAAKKNVLNSLAIVAEQGVKIAFGMYVGFYLVRHLGPAGYGELSLGMSIAALTGSIARLGLDGVVLRSMAQDLERKHEIQGASFQILLIASVLNLLVLYGIERLWFDRSVQRFLLPVIGASVVFQTVSVLDWGQQLARRAGVSAAVRTAGSVFSNLTKLLVIATDGGVLQVAIITSAEHLFSWIIYSRVAPQEMKGIFFQRFDRAVWGSLIRSGLPMLITLFATSGYSKIDHLIISKLYDNSLLGAYAAAIKIFDSWAALPYMLTTQFIPALVAARGQPGYIDKVSKLYGGVFLMSVFFCVPMMIVPDFVISILYGGGYEETSGVLPLVMYCAVMASVVSCNTRVLISEGLENVVALRATISLVLMALLCYPMTKELSILGAALSLCITLAVSAFFLDYLPMRGGKTLRDAKINALSRLTRRINA